MIELNDTRTNGQLIGRLEKKISSAPQTHSLPPIGQGEADHFPKGLWDREALPEKPIRVLLIEDDPDDAFILRKALGDVQNLSFEVTHSSLLMEGLLQLAGNTFDVILLDMMLPDGLGIESLQAVRAKAPRVPVIVLSGLDDEEFAFNAVKLGAQDYLMKGKFSPDLIAKTIRYAIERQGIKEALRISEDRFRNAFDYAAIGMGLVSNEGRWLKVNYSLCEILGFSEAELLARSFQAGLHPEDLDALDDHMANVVKLISGKIRYYQIENRYIHHQSHTIWILLSVSLVRDAQGEPLHFIFQIEDITRRKQTEQALRGTTIHAQQHAEKVSTQDADRKRLVNGRYEAPLQAMIRCGQVLEQASRTMKKGSKPLDKDEIDSLTKILSETAAQIKSILRS